MGCGKWAILGAVWLAMSVAGVAAPLSDRTFVCETGRLPIDEAVRAHAGGLYTKLSAGTVHYELTGPETGPRVVLIHGASGPMQVWDESVKALSAAGHRVLRYDLYGRGFTDRPKAIYNLDLFVQQLEELLAKVGWTDAIDVVGSSMGCIITAEYTARHPNQVRKVCIMGPAGFPIQANPISRLLPIPIVGDSAMSLLGDRLLAAHNRKYYYQPEKFPLAHAQFAEQLKYRGYKAAILSTMRHMPMNDFAEGYRTLAKTKRPLLLLWGREDKTFPYSNMPFALTLMPEARSATIEQAGHVPQYEQPGQVNGQLVGFLTTEAVANP